MVAVLERVSRIHFYISATISEGKHDQIATLTVMAWILTTDIMEQISFWP